ncbi:adenosylcobinamide-phosphate synthase CbiB [Rhizobium sp. RU36D]|uniref:adenosylcobinamide-phosphate synthase CbiB n=1 Tax=Rhizobium sp. RU36D TaxID=1907415 RepID=UPI0009D813BF|nr:adenosylcobinamide-phosphate synthase CbiB [Rhizobium sp. RU36D]SMC82618.1 adenosylcobinamide-phosphate synthase [Rhizobium sp. RU36D]
MIAEPLILIVALLLDRLIGDPPWLWNRVPHPVVLFGTAIGFLDRHLNKPSLSNASRRLAGVAAIVVLLTLSFLIGDMLSALFRHLHLLGFVAEIVIVAVLLAQKSLGDHVMAVALGLREGGLTGGRQAVSMIVGRDPNTLDESGVCRAAIESLSENFADGVVAPAFWYAVLGLPGILAYKMLNTADSMIGHKSEKYLYFGWASARLDDLANWPAARLSAGLIAVAAWGRLGAAAGRASMSAALRDSGLHRSPNSGWPEAAMAGAIDVQLAGPRQYRGETVSESMMHAQGRARAGVGDIERAVSLFYAACSALTILAVLYSLMSYLL